MPEDPRDQQGSIQPLVETVGAGDPEIVIADDLAPLAPEDEPVLLSLGDLLPDDAGEVVLESGGDLALGIVASETVTAEGIAEAHVTATGVDVTGLHFYSFEGGLTLYSPSDLLIVNDPSAPTS